MVREEEEVSKRFGHLGNMGLAPRKKLVTFLYGTFSDRKAFVKVELMNYQKADGLFLNVAPGISNPCSVWDVFQALILRTQCWLHPAGFPIFSPSEV